jgi:hypothetical protein
MEDCDALLMVGIDIDPMRIGIRYPVEVLHTGIAITDAHAKDLLVLGLAVALFGLMARARVGLAAEIVAPTVGVRSPCG